MGKVTYNGSTMTKSHENLDWVCKLHDDLCADEEQEKVWLEKHYGHKPDVLERKLKESKVVFEMAHCMLDHLHNKAIAVKEAAHNIVEIRIPQMSL